MLRCLKYSNSASSIICFTKGLSVLWNCARYFWINSIYAGERARPILPGGSFNNFRRSATCFLKEIIFRVSFSRNSERSVSRSFLHFGHSKESSGICVPQTGQTSCSAFGIVVAKIYHSLKENHNQESRQPLSFPENRTFPLAMHSSPAIAAVVEDARDSRALRIFGAPISESPKKRGSCSPASASNFDFIATPLRARRGERTQPKKVRSNFAGIRSANVTGCGAYTKLFTDIQQLFRIAPRNFNEIHLLVRGN